MKSTLTLTMPATGLASHVAAAQSCTAPNAWGHGTLVSFAGTSAETYAAAAQVAVAGVRVIDLPGSVPRGAPV